MKRVTFYYLVKDVARDEYLHRDGYFASNRKGARRYESYADAAVVAIKDGATTRTLRVVTLKVTKRRSTLLVALKEAALVYLKTEPGTVADDHAQVRLLDAAYDWAQAQKRKS